jgi:phosphoribosylamine--glycine ligase
LATSTSTAVNNNGIYPLEFTSRFGYPTIMIQQEGMLTPISDLFWELANGCEPKWRTRSGFQIGVRIVVPPFPFDDEATFESSPKTTPSSSSVAPLTRSTSKT